MENQERISSEFSEKATFEEWKSIQGYEGLYEISNQGRIKSLAREGNNRTLKDRIMIQHIGKAGYKQVRLCKNSKSKLWKVHILIAKAFIENPSKFPIINHIDGNKLNNDISNLEWCSFSHNIQHAYDNGLKKIKPIEQRAEDGTLIRSWKSISEANRATGINLSHIWSCCNNKRKKAGGFIWQYAEQKSL